MASTRSVPHYRDDMLRRAYVEDPESGVIPLARVLNARGLDLVGTEHAARHFAEAAFALTSVIENYGATQSRVRHLVTALANEAHASAFSGDYGWTDLARALDAAESAVRWQRRHLASLADPSRDTPAEVSEDESATLAGLLLTLARVQAACALMDEVRVTYGEAARLVGLGGDHEEWREVAASVASEIGVVEPGTSDYVDPEHRTRRWFSYRR